QAAFALLGFALLFAGGRASAITTDLMVAVACMIPLGAGFALAQKTGAFGWVMRVLDRLFVGRLRAALDTSLRFDDALRAVYSRKGDVAACFAWQLLAWVIGSGEIWLALHFLGHDSSMLDAIVIEAFIQAVGSAAFLVPGALGVQEAAFVFIGSVLGFDATA